MRTAVMTDSNSGIAEQEAQELGIFLLPMPVIIEDEIHYEGQDLTQESFYQSLTSGKNITGGIRHDFADSVNGQQVSIRKLYDS